MKDYEEQVYYLQHQTQAIVAALAELAPDRPLNQWFVEIVGLGTGKEFAMEHNSRWPEVTRPPSVFRRWPALHS